MYIHGSVFCQVLYTLRPVFLAGVLYIVSCVQSVHQSSGSGTTPRLRTKRSAVGNDLSPLIHDVGHSEDSPNAAAETNWRRILLLIIAITIHNIPGMSVYVHNHMNTLCMNK